MNGHESIRALVALAASGALSERELLQVEQHARECESCGRELEVWGVYSQGLRQLPQPVLPPDLLARTQARVVQDRERTTDSSNNWMVWALPAYSWAFSVAVWLVARALTGGNFEIFGTNLVGAAPWILASAALSWVTAGAAAISLKRHHTRRVL